MAEQEKATDPFHAIAMERTKNFLIIYRDLNIARNQSIIS
jgi:hypothetical protein